MHNTTEDKSSVFAEYIALSDVFVSKVVYPVSVGGRVGFSSDNPFPSPLAAKTEIRTLRMGRNHGGPSLVALRVVEGQSHVIRARGTRAIRGREGGERGVIPGYRVERGERERDQDDKEGRTVAPLRCGTLSTSRKNSIP